MKTVSRRENFRTILRYLKPFAPLLALSLLCALAAVAAQLAVPYFIGKAIDCIIGENNVHYEEIFSIFVAIGACIAVAFVAQYLLSLINNRIVFHLLAQVREDAFAKLQRLPLKYLDARPYGEVAGIVLTDAEQFADGLLLGFTQLLTGVTTILGVLVILFVMRWEIALVVVCVTPLSLFAARFISSRTYKTFKRQAEVRADQTAFIDEAIGNLKVVKAYTHEDENAEVFREKNEEFRKCALRAVFFASTPNPVTRFINSIVYAGVALTGALICISTAGTAVAFTVGSLSSCLFYTNQYTKPFNEITEVLAEFQNSLACAARIFALTAEEEQPSDEGCADLGRAKGDVALQDVSFSYRPDQELIRDFNVSVTAGHRVAIVGPTGCGKTTIINLLMRFYDVDGGSVSVDGQDVRKITRASLRKNYGMVLQETWLKRATVRENLCMGKPDCTEEEMIAAAKAVHAHGFIKRLPKGYDTVIGGEGSLSEGQKQLLCVARVMICRPPMLILDEATSNIDTRTEKLVQDAFAKLMEGRTCFIVAHRLSTIQNADVILVMNAGRIVEQGTHEQLLKKGGFYAQLYQAQF
ncbi:MAG TPA: ABC transporter ATP-binding protein/permease [Candidatus Gallimonas intestinigallinarum]|uniref:ABC transporter ATP-binding protein/permease n=1 Tax=Candidatus Gallimonas intestinigallinarum TaxID=2838604 RepID=A0A9D2IW68_9FIRM|nr:ABC transporter ATP-binding protein/permease [Candidatus Gallimonas intestinigallinarum]